MPAKARSWPARSTRAEAATGLLIVTGGNELRSGAWGGQAQFAAQIAAAGFPVFRFDRRGVGDSEGPNGEFRSARPILPPPLAAFRAACPQLTGMVALGNCDAASALMLAQGAGCDALILSNPWTIEDETAAPPPEAVARPLQRRLADPARDQAAADAARFQLGKLHSPA